ncbi:MAG: 3'-5' exonuclease [Campylobacterota bacterium]|nr:3'-5' exonuclease [Campylobacterota bacterium]
MISIFDCETIPDYRLIKKTFDVEGLEEYEAIIKAQEIYAESKNTTFLPLAYHRVVALSAVIADEFGNFIKVGNFGYETDDEEKIIRHFFSFIEDKNPKLVSFNGRGFDMPMLLIRAMKYNLSIPAYFDQSNPQLNKSKWENYRQRYAEHFHTDLLDSLGSFGAVRNLKLDTLCTMAGIPGKYDVSGDQVFELFYQGDIDKIREYCQSDVLNTYWLYLKYELLKGTLTIENYYRYLQTMRERLPELGYHKVFVDAIDKELEK